MEDSLRQDLQLRRHRRHLGELEEQLRLLLLQWHPRYRSGPVMISEERESYRSTSALQALCCSSVDIGSGSLLVTGSCGWLRSFCTTLKSKSMYCCII
jgi:hypothetical protein